MTKQCLVTLFIAFAPIAAFAQSPAPKVSFSAPAQTAKALFPALSKALGVTLETNSQTKDEVFEIRVKDVSASDLMERMARVANAEWKQEGDRYRLVRPSELTKRAEKIEFGDRSARVKAQLAEALRQLKALPSWSADEASKLAKSASPVISGSGIHFTVTNVEGLASSGDRTPSARAIIELLNQIGAANLAAIPRNARVVFATEPTEMQQSLGGSSPDVIRQYVSQQKMYEEASRNQQKSSGNGAIVLGDAVAASSSGNADLGIGQSLLILSRSNDSLNCQLIVGDINGMTVASGQYTLQTQGEQSAKLTGTHPITLSPLAQEYAKAIKPGGFSIASSTFSIAIAADGGGSAEEPVQLSLGSPSSGLNTHISKELRERILHPEQFDPQSFVPGEAFASAADSLDANLVADLPDTAFRGITGEFASGKLGAEDLITSIGPKFGLEVDQADGWLMVKPRAAATAVENRVDRDALGVLLRQLEDQGFLKLNDLTTFTLQQTKPAGLEDIDGINLRLINETAVSKALIYLTAPDTLRIYATLTPNQKSVVDAGRPISLSELSTEQMRWLADDTFNSQSYEGPQVHLGGGSAEMDFGFGSIRTERTQVLPTGIPENGQMLLKIKNDPVVLGTDSRYRNSSILDPSTLASQQYRTEKPEFAELGPAPRYDIFQPASQATYSFVFRFTPQVSLPRSLEDVYSDRKSTPVSFDQLPDAFRQQVEKQLKAMRRAFDGLGQGAGNPPPK